MSSRSIMPPVNPLPIQALFETAKAKRDTQIIHWERVNDKAIKKSFAVKQGTLLPFDHEQKAIPPFDKSEEVWVKVLAPQGEYAVKLSDLSVDLDEKDSSFDSMLQYLTAIWKKVERGLELNIPYQEFCYKVANAQSHSLEGIGQEQQLSEEEIQESLIKMFKNLSVKKFMWQHGSKHETMSFSSETRKIMRTHKKGFYHINNPDARDIDQTRETCSKIYLSIKGDFIEPAFSFVYHKLFKKTRSIKVCSGAQVRDRIETMVIYVIDDALLDDMLAVLVDFFNDHEHWMNDAMMPFTQWVAKGISWGKDPSVGYRLGMKYLKDVEEEPWEKFLEETSPRHLSTKERIKGRLKIFMASELDEARERLVRTRRNQIDVSRLQYVVDLFLAVYGVDITSHLEELKRTSTARFKPGVVTSLGAPGALTSLASMRAYLLGDLLEEKLPASFEEMYLRFMDKLADGSVDRMHPHLNATRYGYKSTEIRRPIFD
ncbi:hypothetical protein AUTU_31550 [Aureibacter tunicatorum]|nr:hypothetical protein AUTU_31550 [Aureibacter tunicatorum]